MAWQTEIKDATYTSPSGKVFTFQYSTDVSKETDIKSATFTFPEKDGALVVPLGLGGRRFPMTCTFYGANCLSDADSFEAGLEERGYGELQHPIYGIHKVVPTGTIKRSDDLQSGLNVSTVEITFAETIIDETFPESKVVSLDALSDASEKLVSSAAAEFVKDMDVSSVKENIRTQNRFKKCLRAINDGIGDIAKKSNSIHTRWQQIELELTSNIDDFVNNVSDVGIQTIRLMRLPCDTAVNAFTKISGYSSAITSVLNNLESDNIGVTAAQNQFATMKLMIAGLVSAASGVASASQGSGSVDSTEDESSDSESGVTFYDSDDSEDVNDAAFKCREDAVNAAADIAELYDKFTDFCDSKLSSDLFVDTGETQTALHDVIALTINIIINQSFELPTRKIVTLGRDRQLMELLAELYGNFDHIDEFIIDNQLTYDEIELLPMGRQVAYYE